ncbi:MAG: metallophosphatase family protein [Chloroflexota bacterium]|nr:metallophosphatase family protein [Chloroflexota bacterium]
MNILVVSDVHANLVALEAVLADAGSVDALWNIGDTVGYGPRPGECLDVMIDREANPALVGNHDLACLGRLNLAEFNPVARAAAEWTALRLSPEHRAYLSDLPPLTTAHGYTLAHGSPRAPIWEYITSASLATANFPHFDTDVCLIGHTHVAMYAELLPHRAAADVRPFQDGETLDLSSARFLVNPGSVGQPRDRDPRAAYAILDTERRTITAHRVEYDIRATQLQMAQSGLPEVLIQRLAYGT